MNCSIFFTILFQGSSTKIFHYKISRIIIFKQVSNLHNPFCIELFLKTDDRPCLLHKLLPDDRQFSWIICTTDCSRSILICNSPDNHPRRKQLLNGYNDIQHQVKCNINNAKPPLADHAAKKILSVKNGKRRKVR